MSLVPMESYTPGSLSSLINQSGKKPKKQKKSGTESDRDSELANVFDTKKAEQFLEAAKVLQPEPPVKAEQTEPELEVDERQVHRIKGKLIKQQLRDRDELNTRTVFIGNLPTAATKKELMKFFKKFGDIESVRFRSAMPKDLTVPRRTTAIKKDFHPLSKNLNAYMVFKTVESATKAQKRNGKEFMGSHLRVDLADRSDKEPNRNCSIFIGNLPFDCQEDALRRHFESCGTIVNVRIIKDKETRLGKGFGYIEFKTPDGVSLALQLDGQKFTTQKLRVQRCVKITKNEEPVTKSWTGTTSIKGDKKGIKRQAQKSSTKGKSDQPPAKKVKKPRHKPRTKYGGGQPK